MKHLILATAGHVDHGKSSLIYALTGTDPDRLPEEKARGITIVLGFAELSLTGTDGKPIHLGIVDVPGHEDFIKNMVAGVGSVDVALLVIAANEGWKPQTQEHVEILTHLGVSRAVVALAKADLVDDLASASARVGQRLRNTPFQDAPIVPTAVSDSKTLDQLKRALAEVCTPAPQPIDAGKPRLFVDRVFTVKGAGTIVTGALSGGRITRGEPIAVQPRGLVGRVRRIQTHGREAEEAGPGQRVALNLGDIEPGNRTGSPGVQRGDIVTIPGTGAVTTILDVDLLRIGSAGTRIPRVRTGAGVVIHHGSSARQARLRLIDAAELAPGESSCARLSFDEPIFAFAGDRFVVRNSSARATIAGGVVLDATPPEKLAPAQRALLRTRREDPASVEHFLASALLRDHWFLGAETLVQSRFSASEVTLAAERMAAKGALVKRQNWLADGAWWKKQLEAAAQTIDAGHQAHPDQPGLDLSQLRGSVNVPGSVMDALLSDLCANGFVRTGAAIARQSHQAKLPPQLEPAGARIRAALEAQPFAPPVRKQLAPDATSIQALAFLIRGGTVLEIAADLVMSARAYREAAQKVLAALRARGPMTASELRELLGANRRVIIPLLERLDRDRFTRRVGEKRVEA